MKPNFNKNKIQMVTNKAGKKQVCLTHGLTFNSLDELMQHEESAHNNEIIKEENNDSSS